MWLATQAAHTAIAATAPHTIYVATPSDFWTVLAAVATGISALVLVVGYLVASRYGRRAQADLRVDLFARPSGLGLKLRAEVRALGVRRLRLATEPALLPAIRVFEVVDTAEGHRRSGRGGEVPDLFEPGELVDPGERSSATRLFRLPDLREDTIGWEVEFTFAFKKQFPRLWTVRGRSFRCLWGEPLFWQFGDQTFEPAVELAGAQYTDGEGGRGGVSSEGREVGGRARATPRAVLHTPARLPANAGGAGAGGAGWWRRSLARLGERLAAKAR
jgi:hypothetical protein